MLLLLLLFPSAATSASIYRGEPTSASVNTAFARIGVADADEAEVEVEVEVKVEADSGKEDIDESVALPRSSA